MVQKLQPTQDQSYSMPSGLKARSPSPVIAKRDPATTDTGYSFGQLWVNKSSGNIFSLGAISGGVATWTTLGTVSSTFTTISAGTFATTTAATAITLSGGNVFTGTGSNAAVGFTFTPKGTGGITLTTGAMTLTNGNLVLGTAGNGISIKSGANARIGQTTLVLGTKTLANTSVTANTRVLVSRSNINASTKLGCLEGVPSAGVGFTINSYTPSTGLVETNDVSIIDYVLIESA